MVFVDTDVLSTFAKIQRLPLLFTIFNENLLNISAGVEIEIRIGVANGFNFSRDIMTLHSQGRIRTHHPTALDQHSMATMPPSLGLGERESIAICKRLNSIFVSNERRVKHHCREYGVDCVNLEDILRTLWELGILMQAEVRTIIAEIEAKNNLRFRTTDPIFK